MDFGVCGHFRYRTASVSINGLPISAFSAPAHRSHLGQRQGPVLLMSSSGSLDFKGDGLAVRLEPQKTALFVPSDRPIYFETSDCASVLMSFDDQRLRSTAQAMLGELWDDRLARVFEDPLEVALKLGRFSHDASFRRLFSMIDAWGGHDTLRDLSGVDDLFYRSAIMAMLPVRFVRAQEVRSIPCCDARKFDIVCAYVTANLAKQLTLTDLERVGGLSQRDLHFGFMRTHGMSPMAWVRKQRLLARRVRDRKV